MKIGTKSLLYGAHAFYLHPFFVAVAWIKLYGFPWHPAIWLSFVVHDWGYFGKPNMDNKEGESHPILGAKIVKSIFGSEWGEFCLLHSRWFAKKLNKPFSKLAVADKYAIVIMPAWLYLPMVKATGELDEYMSIKRENKYTEMGFDHSSPEEWFKSVKRYIHEWVILHKNTNEDLWMGNASSITEAKMATLPGYLDGGFEHDRYNVKKTIGDTDPNAKYMVFRYDGQRDPHSINACLMYAVSVEKENPDLASGIFEAIRAELGLSHEDYETKYGPMIAMMESIT